jgi:hypothetical protein
LRVAVDGAAAVHLLEEIEPHSRQVVRGGGRGVGGGGGGGGDGCEIFEYVGACGKGLPVTS